MNRRGFVKLFGFGAMAAATGVIVPAYKHIIKPNDVGFLVGRGALVEWDYDVEFLVGHMKDKRIPPIRKNGEDFYLMATNKSNYQLMLDDNYDFEWLKKISVPTQTQAVSPYTLKPGYLV